MPPDAVLAFHLETQWTPEDFTWNIQCSMLPEAVLLKLPDSSIP